MIKIALIQSDIQFGKPEENYKHIEQKIKEAAQKPVELIVLPELWTTAYDLSRIEEIGDQNGERTKEFLKQMAIETKTTIVGGSIAEIDNGKIYNTTFVISSNGELLADYRKIHLFRLMEEEKFLTAGTRLSTFQLHGEKIGLSICYDLRFPEIARTYALKGASALIIPAEWPHPRLHHWRTLLQARAIENQMYIIACNRVGKAKDTHFFGHSMIVDPWGEILVEGGEEEIILYGEIDIAKVAEVRKKIPVFEDRQTELYQ